MIYGQLVIGPPGSGKTRYCEAVSAYIHGVGREVGIVNLDPGNEDVPYRASVDVRNLITVQNVMENVQLGPNGGLIYCMEFLEKRVDWLLEELRKCEENYLLFDCPGQVELYTHHQSVQKIVETLMKSGFSLCAVHIVDSHYCCDPSKFMAVLLTSLSTMLQMEIPHINVLSKGDLLERHANLHFNIDFYTEVLDLEELVNLLSDDPFLVKYKKLNTALKQLVEQYSLVSFYMISIKKTDSIRKVIMAADKANGCVFGVREENRDIRDLLSSAMRSDFEDVNITNTRDSYIKMAKERVQGYLSKGR